MTRTIERGLRRARDRLGPRRGGRGAAAVRATAEGHGGGAAAGASDLLALQRSAGNAAVRALVEGKKRASDDAVDDIETALTEVRKNNPDIDRVEAGLKAAQRTGVPVDLEGEARKPPPSALKVVRTGFGPAAVPPKPPKPAPGKPPPKSPLAKAAKAPAKPTRGQGRRARGGARARPGEGGEPGGRSSAGGGTAPAAVGGAGALAGAEVLKPPVPPAPIRPVDDPGFRGLTRTVGSVGTAKKTHPPAASKAKEAQEAAQPPAGDVDSQAKAAKVTTMDAQKPAGFDKKAFITAVKAAIEAKSPKTLEEADEYEESGKAGEVKGEVQGLVGQEKEESGKDIEEATEASPDPSKAVPKHVTPMPGEDPGSPKSIDPTSAVPKPVPAEQTNLQYGKHQVEQELAEEEVTDETLQNSGEPEFATALDAKREAADHADSAPRKFRQEEKTDLSQTKSEIGATTAQGMAGMHSSRASAVMKVAAGKQATKGKDEQRRAEVTTRIQAIYTKTETDVRTILDGLDPKVEKAFQTGEEAARATFERYVNRKMSAYKRDRYGGWLGGFKWAKDKILGMPSKVNEFFDAGRELYLKEMDKVISRVADIIAEDLNAAKARIGQGRQEIADYVESLPADLKKVGQEAADEIGEQFAQLEADVNSKQESLVQSVADKYAEARDKIDARVEELQAENKGLVDKAIDAVKNVVGTIKKLKDLFMGVLAKAASAFKNIIKDPIGFITKFMNAVKQGFLSFKDNILQHLKKGLLGWLFGALAGAGIQLPDSFDLKGILKLVAQILGLTWASIKQRLAKLVPMKVINFLESKVEIFVILGTEGVGGIWKWILGKIGDLKERVLGPIKEFVVEKIIKAGVSWVLGMLNPAGALVKIVQALISVVQWIMERGAQLADFIGTIVDAVKDVAGGGGGGVPQKIENSLSKALPLVISFLASLLGLGGISEKVKSVIQAIQRPVSKAIDSVVKSALKAAGGLVAKAKSRGAKAKAKVLGGDDSPEGKRQRLGKAMTAALRAANRFSGKTVGRAALAALLPVIRMRYGLARLSVVPDGSVWAIEGVINPKAARKTSVRRERAPQQPTGRKPAFGKPGAVRWRYQRYLCSFYKKHGTTKGALALGEWKERHYVPAKAGKRPGRRGGPEQVRMKNQLAKKEGVTPVENVNLGGRYPDGIKKRLGGGTDYYEVGKMLENGQPEARERVKIREELVALKPRDRIIFVSKKDRSRRVIYRKGDPV